jgi:hypothetical protein
MSPVALPLTESSRHLVPLVERAINTHRQGAIETARPDPAGQPRSAA